MGRYGREYLASLPKPQPVVQPIHPARLAKILRLSVRRARAAQRKA